jgi:peptide/nickel transport system substrate-binding protein
MSFKSLRRLLVAASALIATVVIGGVSTGAAAGAATPTTGGTITFGTDVEPSCLDPHGFGDNDQAEIGRQFLDSLVSELPSGKAVPWLATSWTISPDGKTYTFHLKQGVNFTDGTPFNAAAVVANFNQELDPATQSGSDLVYLQGVYGSSEAINDSTVQVNLLVPFAPFLDDLAQPYFGIESPKAMARGEAANCESPVGTGPFVVQNWVHGQSVTLLRNPNYNSAPANALHQGPAYLSKVIWRFLETPEVRYAALNNGQAQAIYNVPPEDVALLKSNPELKLLQFVKFGQGDNLTINTAKAPFNDVAVRQAFLYASNAPKAVKSAYFGAIPVETASLSTDTPDYDPTGANMYAYNPSKAEELLNQAGWSTKNSQGIRTKDGQELTVVVPYGATGGETPPEAVALLQDIQASERAVGFNVQLVPTPTATFDADYAVGSTYNAFLGYWGGPSPSILATIYGVGADGTPNFANASFVDNPALVTALTAATSTSNAAEQKKYYDQAQEIIQKNAYSLNLFSETAVLGINKNLHGVWIEASDGQPVLGDAWLAK